MRFILLPSIADSGSVLSPLGVGDGLLCLL
jgi:hypothetical protein